MAQATKITEVVQVPVTMYKEETKVTGVTLTLTLPEARALKAVLGAIAGDPGKSVRKYTDGIWRALSQEVSGDILYVFRESPIARSWVDGKDPYEHG